MFKRAPPIIAIIYKKTNHVKIFISC